MLLHKVVSTLVYCLVRLLNSTIRLQVINNAILDKSAAGILIPSWHGRSFMAIKFLQHSHWHAMISLSKDGQFLSEIYKKFGFKTIRGGSRKGASRVAIEAIRELRKGSHIVLTPDGPLGPRGCAKEGIIYLAQKSGAWIIPAGAAANPCWFANSWDRFMIPKPFSKACIVFGTPFQVPADTIKEGLEGYRLKLEQAMNQLQLEAENRVGWDDTVRTLSNKPYLKKRKRQKI